LENRVDVPGCLDMLDDRYHECVLVGRLRTLQELAPQGSPFGADPTDPTWRVFGKANGLLHLFSGAHLGNDDAVCAEIQHALDHTLLDFLDAYQCCRRTAAGCSQMT